MKKVKIAVIGSDIMAMDLINKILSESKHMELALLIGTFEGQSFPDRMRELDIEISEKEPVEALEGRDIQIVFNTTGKRVSIKDIFIINMFPSQDEPAVIPYVNLDRVIGDAHIKSVNLSTFGAQAAIPVVYAISSVQQVEYAEIVSTVASEVADSHMRNAVDEFIDLTSEAAVNIGGAREGKAISLLSPVSPPVLMRNTVYVKAGKYDMDKIINSVDQMEKCVQEYVPGYRVIMAPIVDEGKVVIMTELMAKGDILLPSAGNIEIMVCSALKTGEMYSRNKLLQGGAL